MSRLMIRALVALITFTFGLASAKLGGVYRCPVSQSVEVGIKKVPAPKSAAQLVTFENTGEVDMSLVDYLSSDGVNVRYGCFEQEFAFRAELPASNRETRIIERTPKLNAKGERVGERVVWIYSNGSYTEAGVAWTEGSRRFDILAPSLWYALAFERSKVWANQGCTDFRTMQFSPVAQPNNSFNRSAR
jgi:hypothetical protein